MRYINTEEWQPKMRVECSEIDYPQGSRTEGSQF